MVGGRYPVNRQSDESATALYQRALNTALRLLLRRDHSNAELISKLNQRGFDDEIIRRVVAECQRLDYLNDERTAGALIRKLSRKGFGSKRIRLECDRKGLKRELMEGIFHQSVSEENERECAERVLQKYISKFDREKDDLKRRAKIYRFLFTRGFPDRVISDLISKLD
jgi:regulatory protein